MVSVTVLLILMTYKVIVTEGSCSYCCSDCGEILVESKEVFINDTINITCQLSESYSKTENSTALYFTGDGYPNKLNSVIFNETTVILQHTVTSADHKKNLYCETNKGIVDRIELFIDYFPQKVTDFSCVYEDLEKLDCSWKHPVTYLYPEYITVTFEWKRKKRKPFSTCPTVIDLISCGNITSNIHGWEIYFRVNVTNTQRQVTTTTLITRKFPDTIRNLYGKPKKVKKIYVKEKNTSSIELMWDLENGNEGNILTVSYNSTEGPKSIITTKNSTVIQGLTTYTAYIFHIEARYHDLLQTSKPVGLPSDAVSIVVWTSQDVAKSPPRVTNGGFLSLESTESRNITVYWQNFKDMNTNGPIIGYDVVFQRKDGRVENHTVNDVEKSQFTLYNIPYRVSGYITIKAATEVGMSEASPPIYISSSAGAVNPPTILLEIYSENSKEFNMSVSWTKQNSEKEVKGYTVYWCESTVGCQKQINWMNVAANRTSYNVENLDINQNYLFGVSLETGEFSSGFKWEKCFYRRDKQPEKPSPLQISGTEDTAISVTWSRPRCDEFFPFIKYYIVYWCPVDEFEQCTQGENSSVEIYTSTRTTYMSYRIEILISGTKYAVWLTAVSTAGIESVGTKNYNVSTTESRTTVSAELLSGHMRDRNTLVIIIVVPLSLVVLIAIVICIFTDRRYGWYGKLKEMFFEKLDIETPVIRPGRPNCNPELSSGRNENGSLGSVHSGYDNPSLNLTEPHENRQGIDELQTSAEANTPANPEDLSYIQGDNPEIRGLNCQSNLDYTKIGVDCGVDLFDNENSRQTTGSQLSLLIDSSTEVSCSEPLLNSLKTGNNVHIPGTNTMVMGKNSEDVISKNDSPLEKQNINNRELPSKIICSVHDHNQAVNCIQFNMDLSEDSGQSTGSIELHVVIDEISSKEKSVSHYMSHDKILICNTNESSEDVNNSGMDTSSSKYIYPPNSTHVISNKTSSGIGTSAYLDTSLCNKTESGTDDDTSDDQSSINSSTKDFPLVFQTNSINQIDTNRMQPHGSFSPVSSYSVESDKSSGSSQSEMTQYSFNIQHEHSTVVQSSRIDDGYKTMEDLNLISPVDVSTSQTILQNRLKDPVQSKEPDVNSSEYDFSDENIENGINLLPSNFAHINSTCILSTVHNNYELCVPYLYEKNLDNERQEMDQNSYTKQNNTKVIDENFNIHV